MESDNEFYKTICRVCLTYGTSGKMVSLVDEVSEDGLSCYGKAVGIFANIRVNKRYLPKFMCPGCLSLLKQAIIFKKKCEKSESELTKLTAQLERKQSIIEEKVTQYVIFKHYFAENNSDNTRLCVSTPKTNEITDTYRPKTCKSDVQIEFEAVNSYDWDNHSQDHLNSEGEDNLDRVNDDIEDPHMEDLLSGIETVINMNKDDLRGYKKKYPRSNKIIRKIERKIKSKNIAGKITSRSRDVQSNGNLKINKNNIVKQKKMHRIQRDITCKICSKVLATAATYKSHMQSHYGYRYVCEHCAKGFAIRAQLLYHQAAVHKIGRLHICKECGYRAARKFDLTVHQRTHTGERPYACDKCGLTFLRRFVWKKHAIYHMEKTIQCPHCPRKFYQRGDMLSHVNNIHERMYVYSCPQCDITYAKAASVRRHLIEKHGVAREQQGAVKRLHLAKFSVPKT